MKSGSLFGKWVGDWPGEPEYDSKSLTKTPLLSTRRKVEDQGWQRREGREEGGSRTWQGFDSIFKLNFKNFHLLCQEERYAYFSEIIVRLTVLLVSPSCLGFLSLSSTTREKRRGSVSFK